MDTESTLYEHEEQEARSHGIDVPAWIEQDITAGQIAAIIEGGCASGAYMPAVTYYDARQTMSEHGDDVLDYLQEALGELPKAPDDESWSGLACHYLSAAVELWASSVAEDLAEALEGDSDDDE